MFGRVLFAGCTYEAVALATGKVPTITRIVWGCRRRSLPVFATSVVAVASGLVWAGYHLLAEGWEDE